MSAKTFKLTGSGSVLEGSEISFSFTEDVTSLEPTELSGGTSQVQFQAIAVEEIKTATAHPNSKFLINNTMSVIDDADEIEFRVRRVSKNNELVSVTGETVQARLDVEKTAEPVAGTGATLKEALDYYCSLVDVFPVYDSDLLPYLDNKQVSFIGWQGNVWEQLKALCAGVSASNTEDIPIEMYIDIYTLNFRIAKNRTADLISNASDISLEIDSFDASQQVDITVYETEYKQNAVVTEEEDRTDEILGLQNVSINDQLQVEAGEVLIKRFPVKASLESVNQPVNVASISSLPYTGTTGEYVVVGSDDLPILPAQWQDQGGRLSVALTENPNEIEITIIAPPVDEIEAANGDTTLAPYKIGIESAGAETYPALWITGTGVFFEKKLKSFYTGADSNYTSEELQPANVENIFMNTTFDVATRGVAAAQYNCGPKVNLKITNPVDCSFGTTIGSTFIYDNNKFRVTSVRFNQNDAEIEATGCASIADFNGKWTGKTFDDLTDFAFDPDDSLDDYLSFNEFTTIPLAEA